MEPLAIMLVSVSCVTHAAWNLICKRCGTSPAFFLLTNALVVCCGWPVLFVCDPQELANLPAAAWFCLLLTGLFQAGYFAFLASAYHVGDVSLVYPIARLSPIFVVLAEVAFFRRIPAVTPTLGILLAAGGCFVLSKGPSTITAYSAHPHAAGRAVAWALATAAASAGYTLVDFIGIQETCRVIPELRGALVYGYLEWATTALMLIPVALLFDRKKPIRQVWRTQVKYIVFVAILCYVTYTLVLWGFVHTQQVAYVAGFRQLSIVLGVVGGALILKERFGFHRLAGAIAITGGLLLIVAGQ